MLPLPFTPIYTYKICKINKIVIIDESNEYTLAISLIYILVLSIGITILHQL